MTFPDTTLLLPLDGRHDLSRRIRLPKYVSRTQAGRDRLARVWLVLIRYGGVASLFRPRLRRG